MKLPAWARANGIHPKTAYSWHRKGTMPFPTRQVGPKTILVDDPAFDQKEEQPIAGLYARVSSSDQKADLDRQTARLCEWAAREGIKVGRVESETASGMNGSRRKLQRLLADPQCSMIVVEHRDRLARMNSELIEAALRAQGRRLVVLSDDEVEDDLVRDVIEVMTSFCARMYGRRSAKARALKAVECAAETPPIEESS